MSDTRALGLIGLAARAGGVVDGSERVLSALKKSHRPIVFLASDAGENTAKKIHDKCTHYQVALNEGFTKEELSKAIGKKNRTVIAVTDERFVKPLCKP
ncbi:MAG: L7Ae/L30e/S12e/Gadd45 family ribosomal protein [Bacillota bacterium]